MSILDNSGADTAMTKAIELNPTSAQAYASRAEARLLFLHTKEKEFDSIPKTALVAAKHYPWEVL